MKWKQRRSIDLLLDVKSGSIPQKNYPIIEQIAIQSCLTLRSNKNQTRAAIVATTIWFLPKMPAGMRMRVVRRRRR